MPCLGSALGCNRGRSCARTQVLPDSLQSAPFHPQVRLRSLSARSARREHMHTHAHAHAHAHMHMRTHMHMRMCVCVHVCVRDAQRPVRASRIASRCAARGCRSLANASRSRRTRVVVA